MRRRRWGTCCTGLAGVVQLEEQTATSPVQSTATSCTGERSGLVTVVCYDVTTQTDEQRRSQ